jgi:hypothetical protein
VQVPPVQLCPLAPHAAPQLPQLFGSVSKFTHALPQTDSPDGHAHTPSLQVSPVTEHVAPQVPQLAWSV